MVAIAAGVGAAKSGIGALLKSMMGSQAASWLIPILGYQALSKTGDLFSQGRELGMAKWQNKEQMAMQRAMLEGTRRADKEKSKDNAKTMAMLMQMRAQDRAEERRERSRERETSMMMTLAQAMAGANANMDYNRGNEMYGQALMRTL